MNKLIDADQRKLVGAFIMLGFAVLAFFRWTETNAIFFILLAFRDLIAAYYLSIRKQTEIQVSIQMRLLAYASSAVPLCYLKPTTFSPTFLLIAILLNIAGFLLSTLATIELGDRMGVAPAKRGEICQTGVYRLTKHPMYVGYIIAELGNVLLNPLNVLIFIFSMGGYSVRAIKENHTLATTAGSMDTRV